MRGEIYDIYGKTFFTFGGARSHDIRELATDKELEFDYTVGVLQPDDPNLKHKMKMLDDLKYLHARKMLIGGDRRSHRQKR